jgi:hypothetical protein
MFCPIFIIERGRVVNHKLQVSGAASIEVTGCLLNFWSDSESEDGTSGCCGSVSYTANFTL